MVVNTGGTWYLGKGSAAGTLTWSTLANTAGFGNILDSNHKIFIGDFNGDGRSDVLFYCTDGHWWLGAADVTGWLNRQLAYTSTWYGNLLTGHTQFFLGYWNYDTYADVLIYDNTYNIWIGVMGSSNGSLSWYYMSQTGFGNLLDGKHMLFSANLAGEQATQILFLDNMTGDKNLWYAKPNSNSTLSWFLADGSGTMDWPFKL